MKKPDWGTLIYVVAVAVIVLLLAVLFAKRSELITNYRTVKSCEECLPNEYCYVSDDILLVYKCVKSPTYWNSNLNESNLRNCRVVCE